MYIFNSLALHDLFITIMPLTLYTTAVFAIIPTYKNRSIHSRGKRLEGLQGLCDLK